MNIIWQKQIQNNKLFHAYILFGKNHNLLEEEINYFIKSLNINKIDVSSLESEEPIKISQVRDFTKKLYIKPFNSNYKIAIIKNVDRITLEAANKLLKIVEEPPKDTIFILTSDKEKNILATIASRCQKIKIFSLEGASASDESIDLIKKIISGNLREKFALANDVSQNENILKILDDWLIYFRADMLQKSSALHNIKEINKSKKILKYNVSKKLLLENLFLELI